MREGFWTLLMSSWLTDIPLSSNGLRLLSGSRRRMRRQVSLILRLHVLITSWTFHSISQDFPMKYPWGVLWSSSDWGGRVPFGKCWRRANVMTGVSKAGTPMEPSCVWNFVCPLRKMAIQNKFLQCPSIRSTCSHPSSWQSMINQNIRVPLQTIHKNYVCSSEPSSRLMLLMHLVLRSHHLSTWFCADAESGPPCW